MLTSQVKFNLLTREQVMGALKSTGSKDPDVLLAAKEEFASNYRPDQVVRDLGHGVRRAHARC